MANKTNKLTDTLVRLQQELTTVNAALLTAAGGEFRMLEEWAASLRGKIASLTGAPGGNR